MATKKQLTAREELAKAISKDSKLEYYSLEQFISDAKRYIKACREGRLMCNIVHVSSSGMSRDFSFIELSKNKYTKRFHQYQFWAFFRALGYSNSRSNQDCIKVNGCGMDMVFHVNYSVMHDLERLGLISTKQCTELSQQTPHKL